MSQKTHQLVIKPCSVPWESMEESESGRFCKLCVKHVVDFTGFKDDGVKEYLAKNSNQRICGRITKSQLDRIEISFDLVQFEQRFNFKYAFLFAFFVVFAPSLYSVNVVFGQEEQDSLVLEIPVIADSTQYSDSSSFAQADSVDIPLDSSLKIETTLQAKPAKTFPSSFLGIIAISGSITTRVISCQEEKERKLQVATLLKNPYRKKTVQALENVEQKKPTNNRRKPKKPNPLQESAVILPNEDRVSKKKK